jgi:hypothetical protein
MDQNEDCRIEVTGSLDPHTIEILQLEIRRLAKRCGFVISALRIEKGEQKR